MKNTLIAKVAIANATRAFDREYDYLVPESAAGRAAAGCRALVPFGARDAERLAVILSVYETPEGYAGGGECVKTAAGEDGGDSVKSAAGENGDCAVPVGKIGDCAVPVGEAGGGTCAAKAGVTLKALTRVVDAAPLLTRRDIELAARMREKYYCTWFAALSCMLPAGWNKKPGAAARNARNSEAAGAINNSEISDAADGGVAAGAGNNGGSAGAAYNGVAAVPEISAGGGAADAANSRRAVFELTSEQDLALRDLTRRLERKTFSEALLHGVTGSGKTEIYMRLIERAISLGRQAILLVPEIALTPQMTQRFTDYFGGGAAVFHSRLTEKERRAQWRRVRDGEARIALGARSAVFAPFADLGVAIVDEEHEPSYKSEMTPRYHASEIARMRCESHGALLVFGSATPSVELYSRAAAGGCGLLELKGRANRQAMPRVHIADMREELKNGNRSMFSFALSGALADVLAERKQAILFLNRRGYTPIHQCRACGYVVSCRNCSVSFTYHRENDRLICHFCGLTTPVPRLCPACGGAEVSGFGAGTERIEQDVAKMFPHARILRMDRDAVAKKGSYERILGAFRDGGADILIGTQMIAKGHDFPNVTLVGVLTADTILNFSDFRASERTFQLLTQVAGRSGRGDTAGSVVIQSYNPDHFSITAAKTHDYAGFYRQEMIVREALRYPPYANIGILSLTGRDDARVAEAAVKLYEFMRSDGAEGLTLFAPTRPPHAKLRERWRWRMVLKHADAGAIEEAARRAHEYFYHTKKPAGVELSFDINPFNML